MRLLPLLTNVMVSTSLKKNQAQTQLLKIISLSSFPEGLPGLHWRHWSLFNQSVSAAWRNNARNMAHDGPCSWVATNN